VQQPAPFAEECISMPLDEQAISCYTEEKEVTQESDEKDTLCVSWQYLSRSDGGIRDEGLGRMCWRDAKDF